MDGFEHSPGPDLPGGACRLPPASREPRWRVWLRDYRVPLLFALLLLVILPMRDLWSPDEPDFAQCVREMRERGAWLLPTLNGQPYGEKPILFYWLMKGSVIAMDRLTGGLGFTNQVAAWALRLPTVLASITFMFGFRRWGARFLQADLADLATLILASVPIWLWQSQTIQTDMLFAALLAWSWLSWLGGYLLIRDHARPHFIHEEKYRFLSAYLALGLAFLAKGPLAPVLSLALLLTFLAWQRDFRALLAGLGPGLLLLALVVLPWYVAAMLRGGAGYAYEMVVHQNLDRALHAWDHQQPFWRYLEYLAADCFPWCLLLPALAVFLARSGARRSPAARFLILAAVVPLVLLSFSQSKQGKYLLEIYPFLALLLAAMLQPLTVEHLGPTRVRRLGGALAAGLLLPGLGLLALLLGAGGTRLHGQLLPFHGPLSLVTALFLLGGLSVLTRVLLGEGRFLVRETALTLSLAFLVVGTWGFRLLDPHKGFRRWSEVARPLIQGRQVYFWQTLRSGVLVYTGERMPELRSRAELEARIGPEDRLAAMASDWQANAWGMDAAARAQFEVVARVPTGQDEAILLRRRPAKEAP